MSKQFVGIGEFSEFLKALDKNHAVNCLNIDISDSGKHGLSFNRSVIVTSQVQDSNEVLYHYWPVAAWQAIGDQPMGEVHSERTKLAYQLTLKLLAGYTVRPALVAMPKTLAYLHGTNDLLEYHKEDDTFSIKQE